MLGRAWWLVAVVGCDYTFHLDHITYTPDAPPDASTCRAVTFFQDDFQTTTACGGWGMPFGLGSQSTVTQGSGMLTLTKGDAGPVGCESNSAIAFTDLGVFVAIEQPLSTPGAYTSLTMLQTSDMSMHRWSMTISSGVLKFEIDGTQQAFMQYSPTAMRYVRLRSAADATVGEYASDADHWQELGRDPNPPPATVYPDLFAGEPVTPAKADTAVYSHLDVCP